MAAMSQRALASSVAILLATHRGEAFLRGQLDSIAAQTHPDWSIWASDDASPDRTVEILEQYREAWAPGRLTILNGPAAGLNANFASLTDCDGIAAFAYAYADQDDVWRPDKLARAVRFLRTVPADVPGLYCSRTRLVDQAGCEIGLSPLFTRPPSFANALVQNLAGGNTMVFNEATRALLRSARSVSSQAVIYDWWLYLLVTGAGGVVFYDPLPSVDYRQHDRNLVGANSGARERIANVGHMLRGRLRAWTDQHLSALEAVKSLLTPANVERLEAVEQARREGPVRRIRGLRRAGLYRQTTAGNLVLWIAAGLNRL